MRQCRYVTQPIKNKKIKGAESENDFFGWIQSFLRWVWFFIKWSMLYTVQKIHVDML